MSGQLRAYRILAMSTLAFGVCFAAWMMNGVLITFLVDNRVYQWGDAQVGWLIGVPVLTGAVMRLPMGVLTDRYGGRTVFPALMLTSAVPMYLVSYADSYLAFLLGGLGFGLSGASFAVGVAYTCLWFPAQRQGTALGIFAVGNAGAALTVMVAPVVLTELTDGGADLEGWRMLPRLYAAMLVATAGLFWLLTSEKKVERVQGLSLAARLAPLRYVRVWRFGLYYFFLFGGFVALSQWLMPYYVNMYSLSVAAAGLMVAIFALPAGLSRALGGWASDKWGPRAVLYAVFGASIVILILLFPPRMEIRAPGEGIMAQRPGTVTAVSEREIVVDEDRYQLQPAGSPEGDPIGVRLGPPGGEEGILIFPTTSFWQEPEVEVGERVERGQLLARGTTQIFFQANKWIFTGLVFLLGTMLGLGSAAVYKHIPNYFPAGVGVVGGSVGVLGGLGGFFSPIIFGYLLSATGIWTTSWMFLALVAVVCLVWMHLVIQRMMRAAVPTLMRQIEEASDA